MNYTLFALLALFVVANALQNGEAIGACQTVGAISCYSGTQGFITCSNDVIVYRDCDPGTVCQEGPSGPYCTLGGCNVQIDVTLIPVNTEPLPVYRLGPEVVVSSDYLCDIIKNFLNVILHNVLTLSFPLSDGSICKRANVALNNGITIVCHISRRPSAVALLR